jgi:2'-5' RNA ligase
VAACGLLSEKHFSRGLQKRQAEALAGARIPPLSLTAGALDSFTSAPYLTVEDPAGSLDRIRSVLKDISKEDNPPARYRPHVTLGLYQAAFGTQLVADHLKAFCPLPAGPLRVTELAFCAYETSRIQGPFVVLERVKFNGPSA